MTRPTADNLFFRTAIFKSPPAYEQRRLRISVRNSAVIGGESYSVAEHIHPEYELLIPLEGSYRFRLNGTTLCVEPERFVFIQPGDVHEDCCQKAFRFAAFRFTFLEAENVERAFPVIDRASGPRERIFPLPSGSFPAVLLNGVIHSANGGMLRRQGFESLVCALIWELLSTLPEQRFSEEFQTACSPNRLVAELERIFAAHIGERMTAERIASLLGMSRRTLENKLKKAGVPPPVRLFQRYQMREAAYCLKYGGLNVGQTAERLGFSNPFHFSRLFKSVTGSTPSAYAKK